MGEKGEPAKLRSPWLIFRFIKIIDETAIIDRSNDTHVDKVLGPGVPRPRFALLQFDQGFLDGFQRRVRFGRHEPGEKGVTILDSKNIRDAHIFRDDLLAEIGPCLINTNPFDNGLCEIADYSSVPL